MREKMRLEAEANKEQARVEAEQREQRLAAANVGGIWTISLRVIMAPGRDLSDWNPLRLGAA